MSDVYDTQIKMEEEECKDGESQRVEKVNDKTVYEPKTDGFSMEKQGYLILDRIGEGAYGVVYSAQDKQTGKLVAVKKIEGALSRPNACKRTYRELKLLNVLKHENLISLRNVLWDQNTPTTQIESKSNQEKPNTDIYAVFDLMETDLTTIIKSPQRLSNEHCQFFIYQVLRGLKYIHSANVIHRDLKPRNLLVNSNCDLKICDFGLARLDIPQLANEGKAMTDYVATRWYRPPEVVIASGAYTKAIDMWAVGCILGELLLRKPIFPGADQYDLLKRICVVLGAPPQQMLNVSHNEKINRYLKALAAQYPRPIYSIDNVFSHCEPKAIDLLKKLLVFDPKERYTVQQALAHPYLASLYCPQDEPTRSPINDPDFSFEYRKNTTVDQFKVLVQAQINLYSGMNRQTAQQTTKAPKDNPNSSLQSPIYEESEEAKALDETTKRLEEVVQISNNNQKAPTKEWKSPTSKEWRSPKNSSTVRGLGQSM
uniref:Protein kinase domain-containing protein n=1 Tax=Mucochytrium quahogii TaxID=96639 RepID=A0A7S2W7D2_9STRA|mmetsp:Transcript_12599/g.22872  ORF Transcript_12599/g.22872 Transcript_12599/m.22872 type:complete len:484 (-) Transcript_12599:782-2233(-)